MRLAPLFLALALRASPVSAQECITADLQVTRAQDFAAKVDGVYEVYTGPEAKKLIEMLPDEGDVVLVVFTRDDLAIFTILDGPKACNPVRGVPATMFRARMLAAGIGKV